MADKLIHMVPAIYPQIALMARVSGVVVLHIVVAKDGTVRDVAFVSAPALLMHAALDCVKTWRYRPSQLNGQPVEVPNTISVVLHLQ